MPRSKSNSSIATARAPYAPATRLEHVPFVFYEIEELATRGKSAEIVPLIQSVIAVTQADPEGLKKLPHVATGEAAPFPTV
jgi:hypothetical protein